MQVVSVLAKYFVVDYNTVLYKTVAMVCTLMVGNSQAFVNNLVTDLGF